VGLQARENAKMKVLLMKYIEKDDSLLCSSQLSVGEVRPSNATTEKLVLIVDRRASMLCNAAEQPAHSY